ncbi:hypothetical protein R1flu_014049 [Riccia fluitans]|uniref:Beta-lactamase-related domain-containing protein n=1 Tax=Riccia fluitans TaxID=41844 RepID=A0ABD1YFC4_9MARC
MDSLHSSGFVWFFSVLVLVFMVARSSAVDPPACPLLTRPEEISPTYTYNYSSPEFQSLFQQLDKTIGEFTSNNRLNAYAVAVVHGNRTIYTTGLTSAKFRIASITKTFTALGALMLRDRGLLSLDDHVKTHLPDFSIINPYDDHELTLRELMGHVAGLPRDLCNLEHLQCGSNETEILEQVAGMKLVRPPWSNEPAYSNLGLSLLGRAWEKATSPRVSWEEFVVEEILKPLGMENSGVDLNGVDLAPTSIPEGLVDLQWSRPAAQMYSTAEDLGKYLQFLITGKPALISQSSIREWVSPATIFNDGKAGYAFPWELLQIPDFIEMVVSKSGDMYTYRSHITFDLSSRVGVAVVGSYEPGTSSSPVDLADTVFIPVVKTVQSVNAEFLAAKYAGTYTSSITKYTKSPTFEYKVRILFGTIKVYVNSSLGLLADAQIALMNDVFPVSVNSTWSLLLKNATENSFWFGEAPDCGYFASQIGGAPDLIHPNEPGTEFTNMIQFGTDGKTLVWPVVGGVFHKSGSSAHLLRPSRPHLLALLVIFITLLQRF